MDELAASGEVDWLPGLLAQAEASRFCMRWGCTTCSAEPFRRALLTSAERARPDAPAEALADALACLERPANEEAVGFALMALVRSWGRATVSQAARTWPSGPAAEVFTRMEARADHLAEISAAYRAANDPANVAQHRAEKAAAKHEAHLRRLAAKAERDALARAEGRLTAKPRSEEGDG